MRNPFEPVHRALRYTFGLVNAIVEQFDRLWLRDPARRLIHLPAHDLTLTADDIQTTRHRYQSLLLDTGISEGHVVVSAAGNRAGFVSLLLAAWSVGAAVMPADVDTREDDLLELAERFGASAIVRPRTAGDAASALPLDDALALWPRPSGRWRRQPGAAVLRLTSGSTGAPRAVRAGESALLNDTDHIVTAMGICPSDTQIAVIPLSHAYGLGNLVLPLLCQGTAIVLRESFVPQAVMTDARRYRARVMPGVPFMFQHFATHPPDGGWPSSLTLLISAGAKLAPETIRAFRDRFQLKVHSFYGTSETGGIAYDGADEVDDTSTVGWPMPGVTVDLRHDEDVPAGFGRIRVSSNAVAPGYIGTDDEASLLVDGTFLTGDYGTFLPDGRLALAGRVSSFVNVAGRKVQPEEVELLLRAMPGVMDVRVLAAADPVRGEQIAAVIVGDSSLSLSAIRRHCADRLAPHKIPRIVVLAPAIPLTARGKTDQRALQALVNGPSGRRV